MRNDLDFFIIDFFKTLSIPQAAVDGSLKMYYVAHGPVSDLFGTFMQKLEEINGSERVTAKCDYLISV